MPPIVENTTRFHFTKTALEAVSPPPPGARRAQNEVSDAGCSGLRFNVSRTGRKFWFLRYRHRTRKCCVKLGEYPGMSLKLARDRAWEMKSMLAKGENPAAWKDAQAAIPTFREFVKEQYLPHMRSTVRRPDVIESRLKTGALPYFADRPLDAITTRDVQQFHGAMKERLSPATSNHHLILLKRILGLAVQWEIIDRNPAKSVKKFQEPTGRDRYLSRDELQRFLRALDDCKNIPVSSGLRTLLLTGLRSREVFDLRWEDVDEEGKSVQLKKTKSGKMRRVCFSEAAWAEIERMRELRKGSHPFVFPCKKPGTPVLQPHRAFKRVLENAEIVDFRIHDLRHTHATYLLESGASLYEVQRALGHADASMTARYAHLADTTLRERADQAAVRLTGTDG